MNTPACNRPGSVGRGRISSLRAFSKIILFSSITILLAPFYLAFLIVLYPLRRRVGPALVRFWARICLFIFRVEVASARAASVRKRRKAGTLVVSNHTSFLDIFVLSAFFGAVFVSKAEVMRYPIIGQIAWLTGVIFFDRTSQKDRMKVLNSVAWNSSDSFVVVFPQGTTGRACERLPFQRGIFKTVELNPAIILQPVSLLYEHDEEVAWYKPLSLKEHALRVFSMQRVRVKLIAHAPLTIEDYRDSSTSEICGQVEETITGPLLKG